MKKIEEFLKMPILHDKNIFGIEVNKNESLIIQICDVSNLLVKIIFLNPKHIRLNNFRQGNIIFGIYISEEDDVDTIDEELKYLLDINDNNQYLSHLDSVS